MTELSPAAEAVLDAFGNSLITEQYTTSGRIEIAIAAALRAAAEHLGESRAPGAEFEDLYGRIVEVDDLLAIADELEAQ
jgi:hypothetical protein